VVQIEKKRTREKMEEDPVIKTGQIWEHYTSTQGNKPEDGKASVDLVWCQLRLEKGSLVWN
jgi:hypothetical protein